MDTINNYLGQKGFTRRIIGQGPIPKTLILFTLFIIGVSCNKELTKPPIKPNPTKWLEPLSPEGGPDDDGEDIRIEPRPLNTSGNLVEGIQVTLITPDSVHTGTISAVIPLIFTIQHLGSYIYELEDSTQIILSKVIDVHDSFHVEIDTIQ